MSREWEHGTAALGVGRALLTLALLLAASAGPARADDAPEEPAAEVDHLAIASVLVRDGAYDRAAAVLAEVDPAAPGLDLARYHTLRGIVALQQGAHADSVAALEAALDHGQTDPLVYVFLAQARFGLEDFAGTVAALDHAGAAAEALTGTFLLRAQAAWRAGDRPGAWAALDRGLARADGDAALELQRQRVLLLVDLGLFQAAAAEGRRYLGRAAARPADFVAIAEALRRGGQPLEAARVLEEARLRFPADRDVARQLARSYADSQQPYAAGLALEPVALRDGQLAVEAAELFRRAGAMHRALRWNAHVPDPKTKARQRMGLLVELGRHEEAAALVPRLSRLGLLEDDEIVYAAAYALFRTLQFAEAEALLSRVRSRDVFARAMELRRAMDACRERTWQCDI